MTNFSDDFKLNLEFTISTKDPSTPFDLKSLFDCAEIFSQYIVEQEFYNILEYLEYSSDAKIQILQRYHRWGRKGPVPAEVKGIEKGSWRIFIVIPIGALLWILKDFIKPLIKDAWDESVLKNKIKLYLRDKIFMGSAKAAEQKAIENSRYGSLEVVSIEDKSLQFDEPSIKITLEQRKIIGIHLSNDNDIILDEFLKKLKSK